MKNKKIISGFVLSLFLILGISISFFSGTHTAYACYCDPNLAVFPNGNDPSCVNHNYVGNNPTYCGAIGSTVGTSASNSGTVPLSCNPGGVKDFKSLIMNLVVGCFYFLAIRLLVALSVVFFLWGMFKFVRSEGTERESGKQLILWGIIGLFVIVSIMGLVAILQSTFGFGGSSGVNNIVMPKSG